MTAAKTLRGWIGYLNLPSSISRLMITLTVFVFTVENSSEVIELIFPLRNYDFKVKRLPNILKVSVNLKFLEHIYVRIYILAEYIYYI